MCLEDFWFRYSNFLSVSLTDIVRYLKTRLMNVEDKLGKGRLINSCLGI